MPPKHERPRLSNFEKDKTVYKNLLWQIPDPANHQISFFMLSSYKKSGAILEEQFDILVKMRIEQLKNKIKEKNAEMTDCMKILKESPDDKDLLAKFSELQKELEDLSSKLREFPEQE